MSRQNRNKVQTRNFLLPVAINFVKEVCKGRKLCNERKEKMCNVRFAKVEGGEGGRFAV